MCMPLSHLPALSHGVSQTISRHYVYMSQSHLSFKTQQLCYFVHGAFPDLALWKLSPLPSAFHSI